MALEMRDFDSIAEWLDGVVRNKQRTIWTGRGTSLALAQIIAAALQELSAPAYAVPSSDLGRQNDALICVVSRSGVLPPASHVDVLVAEEGSSPPGAVDLCLLALPNPDGTCRPWLPLRYLLSAAEIFMAALRTAGLIPETDQPAGQLRLCWEPQRAAAHVGGAGQGFEPVRQRVIVVGHHATPLQTLLSAAGDKLGRMPYRAMDLEEVGHGFHAQLCLNPQAFEVLLVRSSDTRHMPWARLYTWCQRLGVPCRLEHTVSHHPALAALEAFAGVISMLQHWCFDAGISVEERPIPGGLDSLRCHPGDTTTLEP